MTFYVGQKVVCINDVPCDGHLSGLRRKEIYTVRVSGIPGKNGDAGIRLFEIPEHIVPYYEWRFRPLIEPKAEQSFTHGADPSSDKWDNRVRKPVRV